MTTLILAVSLYVLLHTPQIIEYIINKRKESIE